MTDTEKQQLKDLLPCYLDGTGFDVIHPDGWKEILAFIDQLLKEREKKLIKELWYIIKDNTAEDFNTYDYKQVAEDLIKYLDQKDQ